MRVTADCSAHFPGTSQRRFRVAMKNPTSFDHVREHRLIELRYKLLNAIAAISWSRTDAEERMHDRKYQKTKRDLSKLESI